MAIPTIPRPRSRPRAPVHDEDRWRSCRILRCSPGPATSVAWLEKFPLMRVPERPPRPALAPAEGARDRRRRTTFGPLTAPIGQLHVRPLRDHVQIPWIYVRRWRIPSASQPFVGRPPGVIPISQSRWNNDGMNMSARLAPLIREPFVERRRVGPLDQARARLEVRHDSFLRYASRAERYHDGQSAEYGSGRFGVSGTDASSRVHRDREDRAVCTGGRHWCRGSLTGGSLADRRDGDGGFHRTPLPRGDATHENPRQRDDDAHRGGVRPGGRPEA